VVLAHIFLQSGARAEASLFGEREHERSRNVEGMVSSVSGKEREEVRGALLRGSIGFGLR
jgi:hypothetical protein